MKTKLHFSQPSLTKIMGLVSLTSCAMGGMITNQMPITLAAITGIVSLANGSNTKEKE